MKKVITIGGATQDIFILYKHTELLHLDTQAGKRSFLILEEGKKIEVNQLAYHTGGGATNSAASFSKLGFPTTSFFKIGTDATGNFVLDALNNLGINLEHVVRDSEYRTGTSFISPTFKGDRTVLVHRGANAYLKEGELPGQKIADSDQLYITSLSGDASQLLIPLTKLAKENNIPVATNPGTSQLVAGADTLREALPNIDILILNSDEANMLMMSLIQTCTELKEKVLQIREAKKDKQAPELLRETITYRSVCFHLQDFFNEVLSRGPKIVVVTNGGDGVYVATGNTIYFHPSLPSNIVNTIGAGDAFGSCFVAQIVHGKSVEQALVAGIVNAASVISHLDTKTGLLSQEKLEQHLEKEEVTWQEKYNSCTDTTHQKREAYANFGHPEYKKLKRIINRVDIIQGVIRSTMKHA